MSFWKRNKVIEHPLFGEMEFSRSVWQGEIFFPPEKALVNITIPGDENAPPAFCGDAFTKLVFAYSAFKEGIYSQLLQLLRKYAALFELDNDMVISSLRKSEDVARELTVISLSLYGENTYELTFALRDSDDDGLFTIRIDDGSITGEYIGD